MKLSIFASLFNVSDLHRSVSFYRDVFGLEVLSHDDKVASLTVDDSDQQQVLILREVGKGARQPGRGNVGSRLLVLTADSPDELDVIEQKLAERRALIGRRQTETWTAVVGYDPDHIEVAVSSSLTGDPVRIQSGDHVDQMVYEVGQ
jgi:catechol 2,3-dioxygenase-like lactoylglutathione lyase family enzyme